MVHYLAAALIAASFATSTPVSLDWQADYGKALAATRSDQRPLLVVLDIPANPQQSLSTELLATEGDQAKVLGAYELCHVDASTEYGQKVAEAFGATQFPHTAIIDRKGEVVLFKKAGQVQESEWNTALVKFQNGERPVAQTSFYRGGSIMPTSSTTNISNCPACQRAAMGL